MSNNHKPTNEETDIRSEMLSLDSKRKNLEEEASAITMELTTSSQNGVEPMGISTPLVDEEGYPRADIDVYRARHLRKRLNELKFDHGLIMKKLEELMMQKMAKEKEQEMESRKKKKPKPKYDPQSGKWVVSSWDGSVAGVPNGHLRNFNDIGKDVEMETKTEDTNANSNNGNGTCMEESLMEKMSLDTQPTIPFAKIQRILQDSPGSEAGFEIGDEICIFGTVHHANHRNLEAFSDVVSAAYAEHASITVVVSRRKKIADVVDMNMTGNSDGDGNDEGSNLVTLKLTPKVWSGKGLVGCVFSPI